MKKYLFQFLSKKYSLSTYFSFLFFISLAAVVFAQFFSRYVLNASMAWTEEIARYLFMLVIFLGLVQVVKNKANISVQFTRHYLNPKIYKKINFLNTLIKILSYLFLSFIYIKLAESSSRKLITVDLKKSIIYYILAFTMLHCAWEWFFHLIFSKQKTK